MIRVLYLTLAFTAGTLFATHDWWRLLVICLLVPLMVALRGTLESKPRVYHPVYFHNPPWPWESMDSEEQECVASTGERAWPDDELEEDADV